MALAHGYRRVRESFGMGCWLLLAALALQMSDASAQAVFRSVAISATSGTAGSNGTFAVTFSGYVKASASNDAVERISIVEGATYLDVVTITPMFNDKTGMPVNTERAITNKVSLSPGVHTLRVLATTVSGGEAASQNFVVTVASNTPVYSAKLLSENAPATMYAGQQYNIAVTVQNTGNTTWTTALPDAYKLGSQQPIDNWRWGLHRVLMSAPVAPGGSTTFNFTVTAPTTPGTYSFAWGMLQENQRWFADLFNKSVSVESAPAVRGAEVTPLSVPSAMTAGQSYTVSFNLKNTGNTTWTPSTAHPYLLGSQNPVNNKTWGTDRITLGSQLAPGASRTISFTVTAPLTPGQYDMRWQMVHEWEAWFGNISSSQITVTEALPTVSLTNPSNGATYTASGGTATVSLSGSAAGTAGATISRLEFFDGATSLGYVASTSISLSKALAVGSHSIELRATDNRGKVKSAFATITVAGPAPTAALSAPANNAAYVITSGSTVNVQVTGSVSSSGTISKLEVLDGTTPIHTTSGTSVNVTLPLAAGKHALRLRATDSTGQAGISAVSNVSVYATTAGKAAEFVSQDMPTTLRAGQPVTFSVSMINTGTTTWSEGEKYRLGSQNPQDNRTWGQRVYLTNTVAPGQVGVFTATVTAPQVPGTYNFQWQMVHEYVTWFGGMSDNATVTVASGAGPTATLSGTPTNVRVSGSNTAAVTLTGNGSRSGGTVSKIELFQANVTAFYPATPIKTVTGSSSSLALSAPLNLPAGVHFFKLRSTDSAGLQTESVPVVVNITNSALLGTIGGVRTNAAGTTELYGWTCQPGNAAALNYKVLLDAPSLDAGATELTTGVANVATELDNASVQSQCATPGSAHHFAVNLSTYLTQYAGRRLYVWAETADKATTVSLPCAENNCTMPGTIRVGMTTPLNGDRVLSSSPVFLRMLVTNGATSYDQIGFVVNGTYLAAQPDSSVSGAYSVSKTGLPASATPYEAYATLRVGDMTMTSMVSRFYVDAEPTNLSLANPTAGSTLAIGKAQTLQATVTGPVPSSVKFFGNGSLLGVAAGSGNTWSYTWTPAIGGSVALEAIAYDASGIQTGKSAAVNITVGDTSGDTAPIPVVLSVPHLTDPDAGSLPGDLTVTPNGSASYSIPIVVPPGTAGLQPSFTLNYDSSGTNGPLGLGWKLGGMSSIHRCGKTIAQDGINTRISFTVSDRLCLDGQRLVLVNRALTDTDYWAAGAEYRTEIDSFSRITAVGDIAARTFKVEGKDGRIMNYGSGTSAVAAIVQPYAVGNSPPPPVTRQGAQSWALDSIRDRSGNFITYEYVQDGTTGEHRPTFVRYGGNGQRAHGAVELLFEGRPDAWKRYIDETRNDLRSRLNKIRTYVGNDVSASVSGAIMAREYTLTYEQSPTSGRSQLTSVGVCARSEASPAMECQPATTFSWGKPDKAAGFAEWGTWPGAPVLTKNGATRSELHPDYFAFADFENHGLTDVLEKRVAPTARQSQTLELTPDGLQNGAMRTEYRYFHNTGSGFTPYTYKLNTGAAFAVLDIADFNGDGAPDIVASDSSSSKVCLSPLAAGLPAGAVSPIVFNCTDEYPIADAANAQSRPAYLVDVVGDGRSGQYSRVDMAGIAKLCVLGKCVDDDHPPPVLTTEYGNNGLLDYALANFVGFTQMVDFAGVGKPYDVRFSRPHYTAYEFDDNGTKSIYVNRWDNLQPSITITGFNLPIPVGQSAPSAVPGAMASYTYPTKYPTPPAKVARPPYIFDEPYPGAGLSADFSGSGYSSLAFGFVELGYSEDGKILYNRSDLTVCLSTGRALDCGVRQKYSGNNYKAMVNIADFVGDGAPAMLMQTVTLDAQKAATKTGQLELCRLMGDDTTGGTSASDSNVVCEPWSGVTLRMGGLERNNDRVLFADLLGTGRLQLIYYHGGYFTNGQWQEDGRWSVYQPIDRAPAGQALDRIHSVTNGFGTIASVEYVDGLANGIVTRSGSSDLATTYPRHVALRTGKIVKTLRVGNGLALQRTRTYSYADPAIDLAGRGSLGFGSVIETDGETGIVTATKYSHTWPYQGMVRGVQVTANGVMLSDTINSLAVKSLEHGAGGATIFPFIDQSTVTRKDLDGSAMGTVSTLNRFDDEYGNLTSQQVSSTAAGKTFVTSTVTSYKNDAVNWLIGLPELISLKKSDPDFVNIEDGSHDVIRTTKNIYEPANGLLSATIVEPGVKSYEVKTQFFRTNNNFGLIGEKKQTWISRQTEKEMSRNSITTFDTRGRYAESVTNAVGHTEVNAYDQTSGVRTSARDANGRLTLWSVNGFGRVTAQRLPDGSETRSFAKQCVGTCRGGSQVQISERYFGSNRMTVPTLAYSDDVGHVLSTQTYDLTGKVVYTDQTYDHMGRPERLSQAAYDGAIARLASRQEYDILGRVTKRATLDESGVEQALTTKYQGLQSVATDPLGRTRTEQRNVLGQLVSVTDALKGVATLAYEPFGNLRRTVDPAGNVSAITYNRLGFRTQLKDPDLGVVDYKPDQFGRVLSQSTAEQSKRSEATTMSYDSLDRMTGRYQRDLSATWIYDTAANGKGQLAETYTGTATQPDYRRVHTYDLAGRPASVTIYQLDGTYISGTGYDAWGRLSTQTHQRGASTAKSYVHRYNAFGFLSSVERGSLVLWRVLAGDAAGRVTSIGFGNGLTQSRVYSPTSARMTGTQLIAAGNLNRLDEGYQYDPIGNVAARSQQWASHGFFESFKYDDLNRLSRSTIGVDEKIINYYADGSIRNKTGVGTGDYVYPVPGSTSIRPHAVTSIPGVSAFDYDDNGNLVNGAGRTVTWTSFDMPLTITKGAASSTFRYGSEYQRTRQDRADGSRIIYAGAQEVEVNGATTIVKTYWPNGIGVEIERTGKPVELSWTHTDRLGSPIALSDEAGNVREELAYDPWGKRRDTVSNGTSDGVDGKTDNKGFTNHEMLDQLDLVHMNGRVYDPFVGRFMSADVFVEDPTNGQSYNRYSYVLNNPTNLTDPTGFASDCPVITGSRIPNCSGFSSHMVTIEGDNSPSNANGKKKDGKSVQPQKGSGGNDKSDAKSGAGKSDNSPGDRGAIEKEITSIKKRMAEIDESGFAKGKSDLTEFARLNSQLFHENKQLAESVRNFRASTPFSEWTSKDWDDATTDALGVLAGRASGVVASRLPPIITYSSSKAALGGGYAALGEVTATVKNAGVLNALSKAGPGTWEKVYEAGIMQNKKIETHYFRNQESGRVFDVKIKYEKWHQKEFKNLDH